jgi:hypothetical protein
MADWQELPTTSSEAKESVKSEYDGDEWKYRIHIPLTPEMAAQLKVGSEIEIALKGVVKRISMSDGEDQAGGDVCLRVKAVKLPEAKSKMEAFGAELIDD